MRILPVLDIQRAQAVRALAGDRRHYAPLASHFALGTSDPLAIARGLRDAGATEVYLADLDAITEGTEPAMTLIEAIAAIGLLPWVDAGLKGDTPLVDRLVDAGAKVVVGLESGAGPADLARIIRRLGPTRVSWSLDLRAGVPIVPAESGWAGDQGDPANLVTQATEAGVRQIIWLDLARVGTGLGVDHFPTVEPVRGIEWLAGGGVRGAGDLAILADRGYVGALLGSALHDGRVGLNGGSSVVSGHRTS